MTNDNLRFLVSAGHQEYMLDLPDNQFHCVWNYDEDEDEYADDGEATLGELFQRLVHEAPNDDWDLSWEAIYRIEAPRTDVETALEGLLRDISTVPSGDDDVFDYWPSGVRLAQQVAEELGGNWSQRVKGQALLVIDEVGFDDELLDKLGYGDGSYQQQIVYAPEQVTIGNMVEALRGLDPDLPVRVGPKQGHVVGVSIPMSTQERNRGPILVIEYEEES